MLMISQRPRTCSSFSAIIPWCLPSMKFSKAWRKGMNFSEACPLRSSRFLVFKARNSFKASSGRVCKFMRYVVGFTWLWGWTEVQYDFGIWRPMLPANLLAVRPTPYVPRPVVVVAVYLSTIPSELNLLILQGTCNGVTFIIGFGNWNESIVIVNFNHHWFLAHSSGSWWLVTSTSIKGLIFWSTAVSGGGSGNIWNVRVSKGSVSI